MNHNKVNIEERWQNVNTQNSYESACCGVQSVHNESVILLLTHCVETTTLLNVARYFFNVRECCYKYPLTWVLFVSCNKGSHAG